MNVQNIESNEAFTNLRKNSYKVDKDVFIIFTFSVFFFRILIFILSLCATFKTENDDVVECLSMIVRFFCELSYH